MTTISTHLADRLKFETRDAHTAAERHPLHRELFQGSRPLEHFARLQAQTCLVQRAVEEAVARSPRLAPLFRDYHVRSPLIAADARSLGVAEFAATPATASITAYLRDADDAAVAGCWYVLEGSTNGGRFIAMAIRRAYPTSPNLVSLDPHGPALSARWGEFRAGLDALAFSDAEQLGVVQGATRMFEAIIAVMDEIA